MQRRGENVIRCKPFLLQLCAVLVATMVVLVCPLTPAPVLQGGPEEAVEHVSVFTQYFFVADLHVLSCSCVQFWLLQWWYLCVP